jgi:hypothetical protein
MLGVVNKLFSMEKSLFVCGEDEFLSAGDTLQDPIREIHLRLSDSRRDRMPHDYFVAAR